MKNCFLCDCKSCPNFGIDGYYGLCGERARSLPDDNESDYDDDDDENYDDESEATDAK